MKIIFRLHYSTLVHVASTYLEPIVPPQMHVYPQPRHMPQPDRAQPTVPQHTDDVLEVAGEVLNLAEQVLELQDRGSPTWASLERGGTPTSPYTDDEVGM